MRIFLTFLLTIFFSLTVFAQTEILTNKEIILMSRAGLSKDLIVRKIKDSQGNFDTTAEALIELKKSGVADDVIEIMMNAGKENTDQKNYSDSDDYSFSKTPSITITPVYQTSLNDNSRIVLEPKEALRNAKTIAIKKSSLHPSRQALEKELLKRKDWQTLNLNIVRYKEDADLLIEIGYVSLSWITHRYVYRIYDNKSGTIITAGETTSWGGLAENLAGGISKRLSDEMEKAK